MRSGVVIVAAGANQRMHGVDKIWAPLAGQPLIAWTIAAFERAAGVDEIVLVVAKRRLKQAEALRNVTGWQRVSAIVAGGPRRRDSVLHGLEALSPACQWVIVHDGARPLIEPERITAGIEVATRSGSAIAHTSVQETIKRAHQSSIIETPPRAELALLQTPQVFACKQLLAAHYAADPALDPADDATIALAHGIPLTLYPGSVENLKITTLDDLALAESLLLGRLQQARKDPS